MTSLYIQPGAAMIVDEGDRYLFDELRELIYDKLKFYNRVIIFPFFTFRFLNSAACWADDSYQNPHIYQNF